MADMTSRELLNVIYGMTTYPGRMPRRHDSRKYSQAELQDAVATLAVAVNRVAALVGDLIQSTAKKFGEEARHHPLEPE